MYAAMNCMPCASSFVKIGAKKFFPLKQIDCNGINFECPAVLCIYPKICLSNSLNLKASF